MVTGGFYSGTTLAASFPTTPTIKTLHLGTVPVSPPHILDPTPPDSSPVFSLTYPTHPRSLSALFSRLPFLHHLSLTLDYSNLPTPQLLPTHMHALDACPTTVAHTHDNAQLIMPHFPTSLRTLAVTVRPRRLSPSRTPGVLPPHALLPHLSALSLTYGLPDTELESYFTAARVSPIANLPSLKHLSITTINHSFEQVCFFNYL